MKRGRISFLFIVTALCTVWFYTARSARVRKPKVQRETMGLTQELDYAQKLFEQGFDEQGKQEEVIALVNRGIAYFNTHDFTDSCHAFVHSDQFLSGDIYLFLIDAEGIIIVDPFDKMLMWKNTYDVKDEYGYYFIRDLIKTAFAGGGWHTNKYRGSNRSVYVRPVEKDGQRYVIGAGFYPQSKKSKAVSLVKGAVSLFNQKVAEEGDVSDIFAKINYSLEESFVLGNLYLYALDFDGTIVAQRDRPELVSLSSWDYQDETGRYIVREIVQKLKESQDGVWIEYRSKRARKLVYAERVFDPRKEKEYYIACGYYPDSDRKMAVDLVQRGYRYMKSHGISIASDAFTTTDNNEYRYGDLYLFVYDVNGTCIAHGDVAELVGRNFYDEKDEDGDYYIRELISDAQKGGVWSSHRLRNSVESIYVEPIEIAGEDFVIGTGIYPITKEGTIVLLVKSAVDYFDDRPAKEAFNAFSDTAGKFVRGDLSVFVFDEQGTCYVWGDNKSKVWSNLFELKDDQGKNFIKLAYEMSGHGPIKVAYRMHGSQAVAYIEQIEKEGKKYFIGSSFFV